MARPRTLRSDLGIVDRVKPVQRLRYEALLAFRDLLDDEDILEGVKDDDRLFSTLLSLAFDEYGVRQSDIADEMRLSAGVLGRWARKANLPVPALRPLVIQRIAEAIDRAHEHIKDREILSGRVAG